MLVTGIWGVLGVVPKSWKKVSNQSHPEYLSGRFGVIVYYLIRGVWGWGIEEGLLGEQVILISRLLNEQSWLGKELFH